MYSSARRSRVNRGIGDDCLTDACVQQRLRDQAAQLPGYNAPYTGPSGTGFENWTQPYAYVAILPSGQVVTVTDPRGSAYANEFPTSIDALKAPGVTIQNTSAAGGQVMWQGGAPATPSTPSTPAVAKVVTDPATGTAVAVSRASSIFSDIPSWALAAAAGVVVIMAVKQ